MNDSSNLPRRDFLKTVGGMGALAASGMFGVWPHNSKAVTRSIAERRNIILFTTDQQQELRWFPDGWEEANLPALTKLRNRGVSFNRAYTSTSMCTPSRTTLFTGLYPAQHRNFDTLSEGMMQSQQEHQLDPSLPNIGTILRDNGYDVVWKGKWHLSKGVEHPDGTHTSDDISRYSMKSWNSPDAGGDAKIHNYGGGTANNDGRFFDGSTWQEPTGSPSDPDYIFTQADGPVNPAYEHESAMAFLRSKIRNPGGNPFCLIICLINPHDVLGCPGMSVDIGGNGTYMEGGYYGRGDGTSPWSEQTGPIALDVPPTRDEHLLLNHKPSCQPAFIAASAGLGPVPTDAAKLRYINFYGNLLKLSDRYLGKMLDLLDGVDGTVNPVDAVALRDKSWVIFSSDHGDMAMTHGGMRQKSFVAYEEVLNVPLVWSNPVDFPAGGQVCDELVSHIDFLPTLCAMLGIDTSPYTFKGVNYSSLIEDPAGPAVQDSLLFTYDDLWCGQDAEDAPRGIVEPPNRLRVLIEKDYKYAYYFDGDGVEAAQEEFYDLRPNSRGGTDTDIQHPAWGSSTGKAVEWNNYSAWADNRRAVPITPPALVTERNRMMQALDIAIAEKLAPLPPQAPEAPHHFKIREYQWINDDDQPEAAFQLTWMSRSSTQYQLQSSTDLINWQDVGDVMPGTNSTLWIDQPVGDKAFYRISWAAKEEEPELVEATQS